MAGGITTPALVAAVSNAGGLGSIGAGYLSPNDTRMAIKATRALTTRPFNVNLFVPQPDNSSPDKIEKINCVLASYRKALGISPSLTIPRLVDVFEAQVAILLEEKVPVFSFTFGIPSPDLMRKLKDNHIIILGRVKLHICPKSGTELFCAEVTPI